MSHENSKIKNRSMWTNISTINSVPDDDCVNRKSGSLHTLEN